MLPRPSDPADCARQHIRVLSTGGVISSPPSFDLATAPWLVARGRDVPSAPEMLGLRDVLVRSHELADVELYRAKRGGRNQVRVAHP